MYLGGGFFHLPYTLHHRTRVALNIECYIFYFPDMGPPRARSAVRWVWFCFCSDIDIALSLYVFSLFCFSISFFLKRFFHVFSTSWPDIDCALYVSLVFSLFTFSLFCVSLHVFLFPYLFFSSSPPIFCITERAFGRALSMTLSQKTFLHLTFCLYGFAFCFVYI